MSIIRLFLEILANSLGHKIHSRILFSKLYILLLLLIINISSTSTFYSSWIFFHLIVTTTLELTSIFVIIYNSELSNDEWLNQ